MWLVTSSRASKRRRNSLTVNAIRPAGVVGVAFDGTGDGQESMGEHGQGGPAMPGAPATHLVLIESDQAFGGLERFFDAPALTGHGHQRAQRDGFGAVAA